MELMAYPRFQASKSFKVVRYTTGNFTLNSTSWANIHASAFDVTIAAQSGDVIVVHFAGCYGNEAVQVGIDVATIPGGTVTNYFGGAVETSTGDGVPAWLGPAGALSSFGGAAMRTLVAGDLSGNTVSVRPRYRTTAATNKTLYANTGLPVFMMVQNIGPVDPN